MATEILVLFVVEIESDDWNFAVRKWLAIFHLDARKFDRRPELIDVSCFHVGYAKMAEHIFFVRTALKMVETTGDSILYEFSDMEQRELTDEELALYSL